LEIETDQGSGGIDGHQNCFAARTSLQEPYNTVTGWLNAAIRELMGEVVAPSPGQIIYCQAASFKINAMNSN
jgi:hypothetical protein